MHPETFLSELSRPVVTLSPAMDALDVQMEELRARIEKLKGIQQLQKRLQRLEKYVSLAPEPSDLAVIRKIVTAEYGVTDRMINGKRGPARVYWPRMILCYLARQYTDLSLDAIGQALGGRDHGSVNNACRAVRARIETDRKFAGKIRGVETAVMAAMKAAEEERAA